MSKKISVKDLELAFLRKENAELKRKLNDNGDHFCYAMSRLWVYDKQTHTIHRIGDDIHDALSIVDGELHYHNMQNGDGGGFVDKEGYGYVIIKTKDGYFNDPELEHLSGSKDIIILDKRFERQIREYINEVENGHSESNSEDRQGSEE